MNAVVALAQHLPELRGREVELHGREQVVVAFDAVVPHEREQVGVARGEVPGHPAAVPGKLAAPVCDPLPARKVGCGASHAMTRDAVAIQNRLDLAVEAEARRLGPPGSDVRRGATPEGLACGWPGALALVAAHAR